MRVWVEVSEQRLAANFRVLQTEVARAAGPGEPPPAVLAVVKANAYGHGARTCSPMLVRAGAEWLGVTDATEGVAVRASLAETHLPQPHILIMCGLTPQDAADAVRHQLTPILWQPEALPWLAGAIVAHGLAESLPIHVEIDTGMGRQGCLPGVELAALLRALRDHPQIRLDGVMTHFASTEVANSAQTRAQQLQFEAAIDQIATAGFAPAWVHAGNSSFIDNQSHGVSNELVWLQRLAARLNARAMVRSGLATYGYTLPIETASSTPANPRVHSRLEPVLTWKTRLSSVREIAAGTSIGYNGTYTASRPMRLAILPVGYADGLRRELSSTSETPGGWVMIHGLRAPILGRISMNLITVDITGIPEAASGDEAILLGQGITAEDHARLARTIPYEILCGLREG